MRYHVSFFHLTPLSLFFYLHYDQTGIAGGQVKQIAINAEVEDRGAKIA